MIFCKKEANTHLLLIQRKYDPYKGMWALPGGFIEMAETFLQAAKRELKEETGLICHNLSFLHVFDKQQRVIALFLRLNRKPIGKALQPLFLIVIGKVQIQIRGVKLLRDLFVQ